MAVAIKDWERLSAQLNLRIPALESQIEQYQQEMGIPLPDDYKEFLKKANGAEGMVGKNAYVILWPVDELRKLNEAYQVSIYAPDYLLFGSDGGGEAYAFDLAVPGFPIVSMPFVGMGRELARPMGAEFWAFMEKLCQS